MNWCALPSRSGPDDAYTSAPVTALSACSTPSALSTTHTSPPDAPALDTAGAPALLIDPLHHATSNPAPPAAPSLSAATPPVPRHGAGWGPRPGTTTNRPADPPSQYAAAGAKDAAAVHPLTRHAVALGKAAHVVGVDQVADALLASDEDEVRHRTGLRREQERGRRAEVDVARIQRDEVARHEVVPRRAREAQRRLRLEPEHRVAEVHGAARLAVAGRDVEVARGVDRNAPGRPDRAHALRGHGELLFLRDSDHRDADHPPVILPAVAEVAAEGDVEHAVGQPERGALLLRGRRKLPAVRRWGRDRHGPARAHPAARQVERRGLVHFRPPAVRGREPDQVQRGGCAVDDRRARDADRIDVAARQRRARHR